MSQQTHFEIELQRIENDIAELEADAFSRPLNSAKVTSFLYLQYQRVSLNGRLEELGPIDAMLDLAIKDVGPLGDLYYLKANLHFKLHQLDVVEQDLQTGRDLLSSLPGKALKADLDFQRGCYEAARKGYETLVDQDRTWDNLARLAYFNFKLGEIAEADRLYDEAVDELTAKEMRHYAWVELQRGVVDLSQGNYNKARAHYERAERAYSGHWMVHEHMAELLGASGRGEEAVAAYKRVIAHVPRPDFQQALGELYTLMGLAEQADECFATALASFLESANRGEVHYYHHLADFYADVREDGLEAVKWARKDLELRRNYATLAAMAWALYRAGEFAQALKFMTEALSSGVRDARLFHQAGMIYKSARSNGKGDWYLRAAANMNPRHDRFHVHR